MPPPPNPYIIFGTINRNGVLQNGITVTIENLTKVTSDTCTTDSDGHYIYDDIQASPLNAEEGDEIKISISDNNSTFTAAASPEEKQVDFIYAILTGSAGALVGGTCDYVQISAYPADAGALASGTSTVTYIVTHTPEAGALAGGSTDTVNVFAGDVSGGCLAGGEAAVNLTYIDTNLYTWVATGGAICGGGGNQSIISYTMVGGSLSGGTASYSNTFAGPADSGCIGGGAADITRVFANPSNVYVHTADGGGLTGGTSDFLQVLAYGSVGGGIGGGTSDWTVPSILFPTPSNAKVLDVIGSNIKLELTMTVTNTGGD